MRQRDGVPGRSSARAQTLTLALGLVLMAAARSLAASSASDRSSPRPFEGWTPAKGTWAREGDAYAQTEMAADCRSFAPAADWSDYVYEVKARKTGGADEAHRIECALEEMGKAGDALKREFDVLRDAGAAPEDPRWDALYAKVSKVRGRFRDAREALEKADLAAPRELLQDLLKGSPHAADRAENLLGEVGKCEERLPAMRAALESGEEEGLSQVGNLQLLLDRIGEFHRDLAIQRCPRIAFIKREAQARKGTNATMLGQINPGAKMGSRIYAYDPQRPERGARTIFESEAGFIFDMSASYDARKLLFSFMDNIKENIGKQEDSFHIWEVNVDGTGLRQLTTGPYHDASAVYLPDGRVVFCSTRVESFSLCQDFLAAAMYIMDGDGGNMRRIEYNTLCDTTPFIQDDGSILFTRWEYQDKNIFCVQGLWTINPDGTRLQLFYGNTLTIPNAIYGARQIPGARKAICTMAPHHGRPLGAIGLIDRSAGLENPKGITNITPEIPYAPTVADRWNPRPAAPFWAAGDVEYHWAYADPWPIAEDLYLVAYGGPVQGGPQRYRLFLLDDKGRKVPLYEDPETSCFSPIPLAPRPLPHKIPGAAPENPQGEGTFVVADVYQGLLDKGVKRGQVKELRVMSQIPKKYNTEGPRYHDHYPVMGQGSYYAKYCYGSVPVYE
ncbi:MAG TPA: hypothetical protein VM492_06995, partial [Sumerlaeia bacterium]|nr:hypothetical protein [Sumerlaeia bacterium]